MRFLILPSNNTLSHIAKSLAVRTALLTRGHEVEIAISPGRSPFLTGLKIPHHTLADIQEADCSPAPTFAWFRDPARFRSVIEEELSLIEQLRPDRILGVFRFTASTSAALTSLPFDSLACGCMLPAFEGVLGFRETDPNALIQRRFLDTFFSHSARRVSQALIAMGRPAVTDIRQLLLGRRTFLWDAPEFQPLPPTPGVEHVGPIPFDGWPWDAGAPGSIRRLNRPLALLSMGTGRSAESAPNRVLARLLDLGFHVAIVGGGSPTCAPAEDRITPFCFAPLPALLARADILVCHGGQQTVFEALAHGVPMAILPFHPEQAQNGLCLERLGAGERLIPPTVFWGSEAVYREALAAISEKSLSHRLAEIAGRRSVPMHFPSAFPHLVDRLEA